VFVIKNSNTTSISAQQESGALTFNGNDAIILKKGTTVVDSFGQVGFDPGSAWNVGGVTTIDRTLRRKPEIIEGDVIASDPFDPSLEWLQYDRDDFSGLGAHTVTDNEPSVTGVTPGNSNNPSNSEFITRLRSGSYGTPALYRLGTGSAPPVGLTLDPVTGLLAGTIDASNPAGNYPIIIERYNPQGEVVSTSFVMSVTSPTNDYASWIAGYAGQLAGQAGRADDPDGDGLPNAVENLLGTLPTQPNRGLSDVSLADGALIFHHTFADPPASDVTAAYQWSANLLDWHESGELADGIRVTFTTAVVNDNNLPGSRLKVTATVSGSPAARIFARLAAR
jgi:hypothetical protein